jgi:hypothetical protein
MFYYTKSHHFDAAVGVAAVSGQENDAALIPLYLWFSGGSEQYSISEVIVSPFHCLKCLFCLNLKFSGNKQYRYSEVIVSHLLPSLSVLGKLKLCLYKGTVWLTWN